MDSSYFPPVLPVLCKRASIQKIIDSYFEQQGENAAEMIDSITMSDEEEGKVHSLDNIESERDLLDLANEAPIIKLINLLITGAIKDRASDIHLEPFETELRIRYRIDGVLQEVPVPPQIKRFQPAIVSRVKILSHLKIGRAHV